VSEKTLFSHPILAALVTSILRTSPRYCDEYYVTTPLMQLASFFLPGAANCPSCLRAIRGRLTLQEGGERWESHGFGATEDWTDIYTL